jgi:hypothetical protein
MKQKLDYETLKTLEFKEDAIKYEIKITKAAITRTQKQGVGFKGLVDNYQASLEKSQKQLEELQQLKTLLNKFDLQAREGE